MTAAKKTASGPRAADPRRDRRTGPRMDAGSRDARRVAMLILEVLGGARTPSDAAQALSVSVVRFYALETRALAGLVQACEPRSRGPGKSGSRQLAAMQRKIEQLERECQRRQALLRLSQRALGVSPSAPPAPSTGKRRRKKPTVRALRAAAQLDLPPSQSSDGIASSAS